MKRERRVKLIYCYLLVYTVVNTLFLTRFPFMHSDESWLSGLTSSMLKYGLSSTETFFDLFPRNPHAIKIIFHLIQMFFSKITGNTLFSFRLISLIFGAMSVYLIYLIGSKFLKSEKAGFLLALILSLDVQFIYASHFARQEIIILAGLLLVFYLTTSCFDYLTFKHHLLIGTIIGLLIGVHPNSFMVALTIGGIYLYYIFVEKERTWKDLLTVILTVFCFAGIFIAISFLFDKNFIENYLRYGSELGVTNTLFTKGSTIIDFYQKLFYRISGTYYTPEIKLQLILLAGSMVASLLLAFKNRKYILFLIPLVTINLGYIIIGRYSAPSIIFLFPFFYLALFYLFKEHHPVVKKVALIILLMYIITNTVVSVVPYLNNDYRVYIAKLKEVIPEDANVLVNLNGAYAFETDRIFEVRNLTYLKDYNLTFEEYIIKNDIEYIVLLEEMEFIYEKRPVWNIVYGNIYPYYEEMMSFLNSNGEVVSFFTSPYAMRIVRYSQDKEWYVKIYQVKKGRDEN